MPRFLTISFIALALFISAAGVAPAAHADQACIDNGSEPQVCQCQDVGGVWNYTDGVCSDGSGATIDPSAARTAIDSNLGKTAEEGFGKVMIWIMSLFAWLVGVAALTLDYAVYYTVVTMGDYVHNLTAVGVAWRIMRDVANIMLIFGFLAAGISIIINVDLYGWGQKMLPRLLIAAVFLNFSLFISEAVIDTGNLFATQFYTQINGGTTPTTQTLSAITVGTPGLGVEALGNEGISNRIMAQVGLQTIYNAGRVNPEIFKAENIWSIGFMSIILFMITAFVMFSLAFILIARFVYLIFLIILSPVGFAGSAVPALADRSKKWWDALFRQTITAPILLLLLYVALAVITDKKFLTGLCISTDPTNPGCTPNWTGFATGNFQGFASMMLSFLIAMGLLLYVVYKAKDLGAIGAEWATKLAGKLTFGATAWAGRTTVGWGSTRAAAGWRKMGLSRAPIIGRAVSGVLDRGAKASYDVRGTGALKNLPGGGIDAGAAQKGGFRKWEEGKIEEREKYAKTLEQTTGKFWGVKYGTGEKQKQEDAERRMRAAEAAVKTYSTADTRQELKDAREEVDRLKRAPQEGYAKGLDLYINKEKGGFLRGAVGVINPMRNSKAAENILKEAKKGKSEKELDALKKLLKENVEAKKPTEEKKPEEKKPEAPKP